MSKTVSINLSTSSINSLINKLEKLKDDINKVGNDIAEELVERGREYLKAEYSQGFDENIQDIGNVSITKTTKGYNLVSQGKDLIYEEFGTGDEGYNSPHPEKVAFNLNDYNSGSTIRSADNYSALHGITSGKYWTYTRDGEEWIYTQGVPAGKQMYNTSNYMKDELPKIAKEKVRDVLSKV